MTWSSPHSAKRLPRSAFATLVFVGFLAPASRLSAQAERRATGTVSPIVQSWSFADAVPLDTRRVSSARQIAVPFSLDLQVNLNWTASVTGAAFSSQIESTDENTNATSSSLSGLTDVRVRLTGRLRGDALQATFGANVPVGPVGLSLAENDVLRTVAAPALGAAVSVPGTGLGGTVGLISAYTVNEWAVAVGASYEQRGTYAPLEVTLTGATSTTELVPGGAVHLSFGADGLLGNHRLTIGAVGDFYGTDQLQFAQGARRDSADYQLGPAVLVSAQLAIANPRIRDFTLRVTNRYRTAFSDAAGNAVVGSSGNYFDAGISGLLGGPNRIALALGADVRQQSGLPVDDGFVGASLSAVGLSAGIAIPQEHIEWRPTVTAVLGTLTTNRVETPMRSLSVGLTMSFR